MHDDSWCSAAIILLHLFALRQCRKRRGFDILTKKWLTIYKQVAIIAKMLWVCIAIM